MSAALAPPIFILGCPRSGTTMLRNALRSHPRLAFPLESHFIPRLYERHGDPATPADAERLGLAILRLHWLRKWRLDLDRSSFSHCRTYREVVSVIFEAWARKSGKPRWGDKTPMYVGAIPLIARIFPDALFVHIIRDGRDVALSWIPRSFGPGNVYVAASRWRDLVRAGIASGQTLGPRRYLAVRYEALTANPTLALREICAFVGEPFDESVLTLTLPERARPRPVGLNHHARIVASNTGKWKTAMSLADRVLFESVAGDLLAELGYEVEGVTRPVGRLEASYWRLHDWGAWMVKRGLNPRFWVPAKMRTMATLGFGGGRREPS